VRSALLLALALTLGVSLAPRAAGDEPSAAELFSAWQSQLFGASSVETWRGDWQGQELVIGVARRWTDGVPQVLLHVFEPHNYDTLGFLLHQRDGGATPVIEYYRSPRIFPPGPRIGRVVELVLPSAIERLPYMPGLPALVDLWPSRAEDFAHVRLPDVEISHVPCRVIESRPRDASGNYDRVVTSLARDSGVALDTTWFRGERIARRVTVAPADVERSGGRALPKRRVVDADGSEAQVLERKVVNLEPVFPDQLFTSSNLRAGRFPSY
jgi:hypothetical protein